MFRTLSFTATVCASLFVACLFAPVTASAQLTLNWTSCPGGYTISPPSGNTQTLTCVTGGSGAPTGCSVAGPATATDGQNIQLSVSCTGGAALNSWAWSGGTCAGQTTSTCTANESVVAQKQYGVTVGNGTAPNAAATPWTVTWSAAQSGPPTGCTVAGPATATTGQNIQLSVSCTGGAALNSWAWSGGTCANQTTSTCTANEAAAGAKQYGVTVGNGTAPNAAATPWTVTWTSLGTFDCKSVAGSGVTGSTQVLEMDWSNPQRIFSSGNGVNDAIVVHFKTGPNVSSGNLAQIKGFEFSSPATGRTAVLSPGPCDFATNPSTLPALGAVNYSTTPTIQFSVGTNYFTFLYPPLLTNKDYYFNVKTDAGGCGGGSCTMGFELNKPGGGY